MDERTLIKTKYLGNFERSLGGYKFLIDAESSKKKEKKCPKAASQDQLHLKLREIGVSETEA